jgi:small subunit ribosomal protein S35
VLTLACAEAFRKPFVPPTPSTPVIIRSINYGGEYHPATVKRSIVVPVAHLPLPDRNSVHKCKLLAGIRWTPDAPKDAGVGRNEPGQEHGYIKIACESFPESAMNLKWASDTLEQLIQEANDVCHCSLKANLRLYVAKYVDGERQIQKHTSRHQAY